MNARSDEEAAEVLLDGELDLGLAPQRIEAGDRVRVQTYVGEQRGVFLRVVRRVADAFPSAEVQMDSGATVTIDVARVFKEE